MSNIHKSKIVRFPAGQYRPGTIVSYQKVPDRPVPDILKGLTMPGLALTPLTTGGKTRIPLDEIPQDTIDTLEEAWEYNQENPTHRLETPKFATRDDAENFMRELRSAAYHRKDSKGRLVVSANPVGNDEKGHTVRFRVSEYEGTEGTEDSE